MKELLFKSFFMGGFECSTHRDTHGRRLDLIESTRHDLFARRDYERMLEIGMNTARDGVRWHLIEAEPFRYDLTSLEKQVTAAAETGIEIIWDYFHYGYPDDIDIFSAEFIDRFSSFAEAVTVFLTERLGPDILVCPVNEISFFAWIAGDRGLFYPFAKRRGNELKQQLVLASTAAAARIRQASPTATIIYTDPAIHIVPKDDTPAARTNAERQRRTQFRSLDKLQKLSPDKSGIDVIGLNYYFHNQWRHPSRRMVPLGHRSYRPLSEILAEYHTRYGRPLFIAETGIEDEMRPEWFRYVCDEVRVAIAAGVPIEGICLYPIVNHPGWADDRHCHNGLWDYADPKGERQIYEPLADELRRQMSLPMSKI
jgi:beta-glucosidase/6-phospho-beta-glucosidase/beta-galactosidase